MQAKNNKAFSLMRFKGFSLIEMMVVISIFAVIGVLVTTSMALTLRSSKKSDSLVRVRESLNYSLSSLERQIRNSDSIVSCTGLPVSTLSYVSMEGITTSFSCVVGASGYIASGSATLTPSDIAVTSCSFICTQAANSPAIINVNVTAEDATSTGTEKGSVSTNMEIITRNY